MGRKKKSSSAKVLMILWLITAATALIVTVVYFGEMQKMYTAVTDAAENGGKSSDGTGTSDIKVVDNDANTKAEVSPTDKIEKDDKTNIDPEGQKSGDRTDNNAKDPGNTGEAGTDNSSDTGASDEKSNIEGGTQNPEENKGNGDTDRPGTDNEADNNGNSGDSGDTDKPADNDSDNTTDNNGSDPENNGNDPEDDGTPVEHAYYYDPDLDPNKPIIALSFDDGPSMYTKRVLAALEKYGAKATFFMVGYNLEPYAEEVKAVYEAGCEVANHTTDHSHLIKLSESEIRKKVFDNEEAINKIVPVGEIPLRPPYGDVNDTVKKIVNRPMFNWSVDSLDWKTRNADSIVAQIKQDAKDGYIILMHDIYQTTAEATERILPWLIEQGYQVTCISNMFNARGEETKPGHLYRYTDPAPKQE